MTDQRDHLTENRRHTILVVDDEEQLREIAADILHHFGYSTLLASSGEEALRLYAERSAPISGVLLDLGLPGMSGAECLEKLLQLDPACAVIIASGYTDPRDRAEMADRGAKAFVGKPYGVKTLLAAIRNVTEA